MKAVFWVTLLLLAGTQMAAAQERGYADDGTSNSKVVWADVLRVDPVYDHVRAPAREVCDDVPVAYPGDTGSNRAAGTVIGAIVGGVLGSTVGKGDGRRAATVAGAVAGGAIGNNMARGSDGYYEGVERRCRMEAGPAEHRIVAYDVQYRYRGDVFMSRLGYDPGDRLRVRVSIEPAE
ncbi:glycine zipper 2TM domain-containing protein [Dokdonella sp.]|uniref:glycine zipper 2TM domain-containing protein n=1 Tax=Dokdonella sp. TaxID=2291710 RepID=UPI0025BBF519|nr:glycine zipper 2TM domain-containing protein [Dokdonella sp.]